MKSRFQLKGIKYKELTLMREQRFMTFLSIIKKIISLQKTNKYFSQRQLYQETYKTLEIENLPLICYTTFKNYLHRLELLKVLSSKVQVLFQNGKFISFKNFFLESDFKNLETLEENLYEVFSLWIASKKLALFEMANIPEDIKSSLKQEIQEEKAFKLIHYKLGSFEIKGNYSKFLNFFYHFKNGLRLRSKQMIYKLVKLIFKFFNRRNWEINYLEQTTKSFQLLKKTIFNSS